jgi:hypothetical protein
MHGTIDSTNNAFDEEFAFDNEYTVQTEQARFLSIVSKLDEQTGLKRDETKKVILEYLWLSPNSDSLVSEFIMACLRLNSPNRFETAIDILSKMKSRIVDFAIRYLGQDISQWSKLKPKKKYQPNDDFWYILIRSVGRSGVKQDAVLRLISSCQDDMNVGRGEAVVEALGDLGTRQAIKLLRNIASYDANEFVRKMASDVLEDVTEEEE